MKKVLAICGSISNTSANYALLKTIHSMAKDQFEIDIYDGLSSLPYFEPNPENENIHASVVEFRNKIREADGILICTPEYVFSLPGILKNALEWTVSTTVFTDKPASLITASSSGKVAHESLLLVMKTLGVKTTDKTCLHIQSIKSKMTKEGDIVDNATVEHLGQLIDALRILMNGRN
ncbi:MAG: NADPH-dependent FMN reductase [Bacteroidota bacterium]